MSDNNTSQVHGRKNMKNKLMTWSLRFLAVLTICFLSGCYDGYWWHDRDRHDDRHDDRDRHEDRHDGDRHDGDRH